MCASKKLSKLNKIIMQNKIKVVEIYDVKKISAILGISLLMLFVPRIIPYQLVAGSIVNAVLILSLVMYGFRPTFILCFVPSMVALFSGMLPTVIAPILPFVMISNVVFISVIYFFRKTFSQENKGYWFGIVLGAFAKFLFLFLSVNIISRLLVRQEIAQKILTMFSWPQLFTAISGGVVAYFSLKLLKKFSNSLTP